MATIIRAFLKFSNWLTNGRNMLDDQNQAIVPAISDMSQKIRININICIKRYYFFCQRGAKRTIKVKNQARIGFVPFFLIPS